MPYREFYDLEVYKSCRAFRKHVSKTVRNNFPKTEQFLLSSQLLDASRSVTANLAEGHGRYYYQENIHFCRVARGSLSECLDHIFCAYDESYLDDAALSDLMMLHEQCMKQLNAYISHLKRKKASS